MTYRFDPQDYGYLAADRFPEIYDLLGRPSFVKVIAVHEREGGSKAWWYSAIRASSGGLGSDDRIEITSGSYDTNTGIRDSRDYPKTDYHGLVSSREFAESLLCHVLGTLRNDSVPTTGRKRLEMESLIP